MADQYGNLSPEDYAQQQQINRQQKMAEMLMQNTQQPQGQMVSGRYVAPSFFQNILPLVNAYVGKGLLEQGDLKQQQLAEAIRNRNSQDLEKFINLSQGSKNYAPAVMPEIQRDDMGNVMPAVQNQIGQAPNKQAAALLALRSYDPTLKQLGGSMLTQMTKEPELVNVAPGGSLVRNVNGKVENVFTAPEKLSPTEAQRDYVLARQQGYAGSFMDFKKDVANLKEQRIHISTGGRSDNEILGGGGVNNNGVKIGTTDKMGRYISPTGKVTPAAVYNEAQSAQDAANDLANTLNQLTGQDIKNAFGSTLDYTTNKLGRFIGKAIPETVNAQTKINNLQIGTVLENLSKLKGASSDKEMAQMVKQFPGYEADPVVMEQWVERAAATTNRFLKRNEERYGFDTELAQQGRFKGGNPTPVQPQNTGTFTIKEKGK
jgi:hypothetical protein